MPAGGQEITGQQGSFGSPQNTQSLRSNKAGAGTSVTALVGSSATVAQGAFGKSGSKALSGSAISSATGFVNNGAGAATSFNADWAARSALVSDGFATRFETEAERSDWMLIDGAEDQMQRVASGRGAGFWLRSRAEAYRTETGSGLWRRYVRPSQVGIGTGNKRWFYLVGKTNAARHINPISPTAGFSYKHLLLAYHSAGIGQSPSSTLNTIVLTDGESYQSVPIWYAHDNENPNSAGPLGWTNWSGGGGGFALQNSLTPGVCLYSNSSSDRGPNANITAGCRNITPGQLFAWKFSINIGSVGRDSGVSSVATLNHTTNKIEWTNHQVLNDDDARLAPQGGATLGSPLVAATRYFVVNRTANDFQISLTEGGAPIDFAACTGTIRVTTNGRSGNEIEMWDCYEGETSWTKVWSIQKFTQGSNYSDKPNGHDALWFTTNETESRYPQGTIKNNVFVNGSHAVGATAISIKNTSSAVRINAGDIIKVVGQGTTTRYRALNTIANCSLGGTLNIVHVANDAFPATTLTGGLKEVWADGSQLNAIYSAQGVPMHADFFITELISSATDAACYPPVWSHYDNSRFSLGELEIKDLGAWPTTDIPGGTFSDHHKLPDYSGVVNDHSRDRVMGMGGGHTSSDFDSFAVFDNQASTGTFTSLYPPTPAANHLPDNADFTKGAWKAGAASGPYPRPMARHTIDLQEIVGDRFYVLGEIEGNATASKDSPLWDFARGLDCTISNASPAVVTTGASAHSYSPNQPVRFSSAGTLPSPLGESNFWPNDDGSNQYYVKTILSPTTFTISSTPGGAAINTTTGGSGSHKSHATGYISYEITQAFGALGTQPEPAFYNMLTGQWTFCAITHTNSNPQYVRNYGSCSFDPDLNKIISVESGRFSTHDINSLERTGHMFFLSNIEHASRVTQESNGAEVNHFSGNAAMAYCPRNNKHYVFTGEGRIIECTINRQTLDQSTFVTKDLATGTWWPGDSEEGCKFEWDEVALRFVGGFKNGKIYSYNPLTNVRAEHTMTLVGGGSSVASSKQVHKAFARVPRHNYYLAVLNTAGERRVYAFRFWNR